MTNRKPSQSLLEEGGEVVCATVEETAEFAAEFARAARPGLVLSLEGPLGAGKTQFVKGFVATLDGLREVSSPTFTLVHEYKTSPAVAHFDWYRLDDAEEVIGLGWDDYLAGEMVVLVEWGNRFPELLPADVVRIRFEIEGEARRLSWAR